MKLYGLYSKKQKCLMDVSFSYNGDGADFCNDATAYLGKYVTSSDMLWTTPIKEVADTIADTTKKTMTPWYNSSFTSPMWHFSYYGKLEVVCLNDFEGDSK